MHAPPGYEALPLRYANQIVLPLTLAYRCGQAFRWRQVALPTAAKQPRIEWSLCLPDRVVFVQHDPASNALFHRTQYAVKNEKTVPTAAWLHDYLNLGQPTNDWYAEWCQRDPIFAKHAARFGGVSILRQDPWECMCA